MSMCSFESNCSPRVKTIDRKQMLWRAVDVDQLIEADHPARSIWELLCRLNLDSFYSCIGAVEGRAGRNAFDPQLLIAVWIYAYSRGIASAREIARLCEIDPAFQWLTGMDTINHHTLSDFRVDQRETLDELFTQVLALLHHEGLITLERVMQDGTKVRARARGNSFAKEGRICEHLEVARQHVQAMESEEQEMTTSRVVSARRRAARERMEKLERALREIAKLRAAKMEDKKTYEPRVSMTDPEARIMKTSEGGYAPSYNVQITTDAHTGLIAEVRLTQDVNDRYQLGSAMDGVAVRWGRVPNQAVADGDFTTNLSVIEMAARGIDFYGSWNPGPATRKQTQPDWRGIHPEFQRHAFRYDAQEDQYICPAGKLLKFGKANKLPHGGEDRFYKASRADCAPCIHREQCCPHYTSRGRIITHRTEPAAVTAFKSKMESGEAKAIYKQRSRLAEFPFAWIKEKLGLRRFHVQGFLKAQTEALWVALTFNIQRWLRLRKRAETAVRQTA